MRLVCYSIPCLRGNTRLIVLEIAEPLLSFSVACPWRSPKWEESYGGAVYLVLWKTSFCTTMRMRRICTRHESQILKTVSSVWMLEALSKPALALLRVLPCLDPVLRRLQARTELTQSSLVAHDMKKTVSFGCIGSCRVFRESNFRMRRDWLFSKPRSPFSRTPGHSSSSTSATYCCVCRNAGSCFRTWESWSRFSETRFDLVI